MGEKLMEDEMLDKVCGGVDEIKVQIKTLQGDNDEYVIALTDKLDHLVTQYDKDASAP